MSDPLLPLSTLRSRSFLLFDVNVELELPWVTLKPCLKFLNDIVKNIFDLASTHGNAGVRQLMEGSLQYVHVCIYKKVSNRLMNSQLIGQLCLWPFNE